MIISIKQLSNNLFHVHHAAYAVSLLHLLKSSVDVVQRLAMSNELVDLQLAVEIIVDETGQLSTALDTTESTSLPHTASDQLEG